MVIMDNATFHKSPQTKALLDEKGCSLPVSRRDFVTLTGRPIPKSDSRQRDASELPRHVRSQYGNCVLRCTTHSVNLLHHDLTLG